MSKTLLNLLLIVLIFTVFFLVVRPLYYGVGGVWQPQESVQSLQAMNAQYDEATTQAVTLVDQAEQLKSDYNRLSNDTKEKMLVMVPDSIDKVRLLSEVNSIINRSGLSTTELAVSDGSSLATGKGSALISFTVKAPYTKFKDLMENIEKSMRLYTILSVQFASPEKEGELTSYQVRVEAYYLK